jgi:hypothetical protein
MSEGLSEDRPDFLLEKFATPEDQARAYAEAEREMSRMREEMSREREQFASALQNLEQIRPDDQQQQSFQPPGMQPGYAPDNDPLLQQYQQALDMGDARALLAINLELGRQMTQQAIDQGMKGVQTQVEQSQVVDREVAITLATERVARKHENWEELAPEVGRLLQQNSEWIPSTSSIDAYEKAIGQAARVVQAEKILSDNQQAEAIRQQKINTQGLTGDSARVMSPADQQKEWDTVRNARLTGYSGILGSG